MPSTYCNVRFLPVLSLRAALGAALLLTGCGLGAPDTTSSTTAGPELGGTLYGGANPIVGATVKLYATGNADGSNGGYGVGHLLEEATRKGTSPGQDTDANGKFTFSPGYTCPAGQYAYIVSTGGDTAPNTVNASAVLAAALGPCESIPTGGGIYMNELSTIAAAYALGHFTTVSGTGAATVVGIGAPGTNNAVTGCVANGSTCPTTVAAGLGHAFLNAANFVNIFQDQGAFFTLPYNNAATVPAQLINSIGNSLVACVNSNGRAAACNIIFAATTINSVAPTNTFQAMINLAANPTLAGTTQTPTTFLNAASSTTNVYTPALTTTSSAPNDFSIAINYPKGLGATTTPAVQGLQYVYSGALDINDVFYVGNQDQSVGTKTNIASFSSNGDLLSFTPDNSTYTKAYGVSVDALGNVYQLNNASTTKPVLRFTSSSGVVGSTPTLITSAGTSPGAPIFSAVDQQDNLWYTTMGNASSNVFEVSATGTVGTGELLVSQTPYGIAIDPDQNIWIANSSATSGATNYVVILQNMGSVSVPAYSSTSTTQAAAGSGSQIYGIAFANNGNSTTSPFIGYVDAYTTNTGIYPVTPTLSNSRATGASVGTPLSATVTSLEYNAVDSAATVWSVDTGNNSVVATTTANTPTTAVIKPCRLASRTSTACSSIFSNPRDVAVDSTGSIWIAGGVEGSVVQIIGAAAPTWPLLSLGVLTEP